MTHGHGILGSGSYRQGRLDGSFDCDRERQRHPQKRQIVAFDRALDALTGRRQTPTARTGPVLPVSINDFPMCSYLTPHHHLSHVTPSLSRTNFTR